MGSAPLIQKTIDTFGADNAAPATAQGVRMADVPTAIRLSTNTPGVSCTIM